MSRSPLRPSRGGSRTSCALLLLTTTIGVTVTPASADANTYQVTPSTAQAALAKVVDGDVVVFADGTYPHLILSAKDKGPGVVTLRAASPILTGTSPGSEVPDGLRGKGAVLAGKGTGLEIRNHRGIVVDGLEFTGSNRGLWLDSVTDATVSRAHFHALTSQGLAVTGRSDRIRITQNLFTNTALQPGGKGSLMDYGLFANHSGSIDVDGNIVLGNFNQGMALKHSVTRASFTGNFLECLRGSCLMLGQEPDLASTGDRTVGPVEVTGNTFQDIGYASIFVSNVERVSVLSNQFVRVSNVLLTRYSAKGSGPVSVGRNPKSVLFQGNSISNGVWMNLEGRGSIGETTTINGNQLATPLRACRVLKMSTAGKVSGEQTAGYPTVVVASNSGGLACVRR